MEQFAEVLFQFLKHMDEEATSLTYYAGKEYPTGLRQYGFHIKPNRNPDPSLKPTSKSAPNEDRWGDRLRELMLKQDSVKNVQVRSCFENQFFMDASRRDMRLIIAM